VQRLHFEKQIDELRTQLIETEQRNEYLIRKINELNKTTTIQTSQTSSSTVSVLLPDPK
jgi:predicted RNase H-like nuclease (RuvC/YqgF family)